MRERVGRSSWSPGASVAIQYLLLPEGRKNGPGRAPRWRDQLRRRLNKCRVSRFSALCCVRKVYVRSGTMSLRGMRNMFLTLRTLLSRTVLHPWKAGLFPAGVQLGTIGLARRTYRRAGDRPGNWTRDPSGERSILKVSGSLCRLSKLESAAILISCPEMYFFLTLEPVTGPSDFSEDGPLRKSIVRPGKPLPLQILGHKLSVSLYQSIPHLLDRHCT
jgi:hypothetical protein